MNKQKKVTVAMSGGIDSAVAAHLAMEAGYYVSGATMRLCEKIDAFGTDLSNSDIADARAICQALGISHKVLDMRELFHSTVIRDFIDTYYAGGTPNPCIVCNKLLKFGALLEKEIEIRVSLGMGDASATAWGCDLTYDYVKINGDYRT